MPRDGSDVYNVPSGTYGVEGTTIESARYNAFVDDVAQDLNHPRPIVAGGTSANNARSALLNLSGELALQVVTNYDFDPFEGGSFYSASTATGAPVAGRAFVGVAYKSDANNIVIEARDQNDTAVPGRLYVREKKAGVWGAWKATGLSVVGTGEGIGNVAADMWAGIVGTGATARFVVNSKADNTGTDLMTVNRSGRALGNGMCPPGAIMDFAMAAAPAGWLVCDGQAVSRTTYADLFSAIGTLWGAGDGSTTFNLPNLMSRFRRHRDGGVLAGVVGNLQVPVNKAHTHTGTTGFASADHTHVQQGTFTSTAMSANATHGHLMANIGYRSAGGSGINFYAVNPTDGYVQLVPDAAPIIKTTNTDHTHNITIGGTTGGRSADHTHNFTSGSDGDTNEARPYSATVLTCIKV